MKQEGNSTKNVTSLLNLWIFFFLPFSVFFWCWTIYYWYVYQNKQNRTTNLWCGGLANQELYRPEKCPMSPSNCEKTSSRKQYQTVAILNPYVFSGQCRLRKGWNHSLSQCSHIPLLKEELWKDKEQDEACRKHRFALKNKPCTHQTLPPSWTQRVWINTSDHALVLVAQSCPTLCDPLDYSLPDSCVHEIFQARILEWAAISFSRGSSQFRDRTRVSCTARRFFTDWATREAQKFDKHFLLMLLNLRNKFKWSLFLQKLNTFARYTEPPPCPCTLYCVSLNR